MNKEQWNVVKFHREFGFTIHYFPTQVPVELLRIRHKHSLEEMDELEVAIESGDLVRIADAIADARYFLLGTATALGIDMEPVEEEIHRSNMTKERPEGGGDGKAVKGKGYSPPNLMPIINKQLRKSRRGGGITEGGMPIRTGFSRFFDESRDTPRRTSE